MNRNLLYLAIGALGVAAVVLGYQVYKDRQNDGGVSIEFSKSGVSIDPD